VRPNATWTAGACASPTLASERAGRSGGSAAHAGRTVTVLARVGDPLLRVVSAAGEIVAEHRRAPVGGGQTLRTPEHAAMLERAVLEAFTTGHACRRKANVPPGKQALAELARLRGLDAGSAPVISLERYAQLAKAANR